ncbi:MAG: PAS domain S-box protein [Bacteroidia bacterium]
MKKISDRIISIMAAIVTALIGIFVMSGWMLHDEFLLSIIPGQVTMKFNVALCFVLGSLVVLFYHFPGKNKIRNRVSVALCLIIFLTGLLSLIEYVFGFNLGIDEFFVRESLPVNSIYYAGRMSPLTALNFIFFGIGLLLLNNEKASTYQFFYLTVVTFFSLLMMIVFNFITDIPTFFRLALHVSIGFITLSGAVYLAQPILRKKIFFMRKMMTGFMATIILMLVISTLYSYYTDKLITTSRLIEHTKDVLNESEKTLSLTKDIESGGRGYALTADSDYLKSFFIAKESIYSHIQKLKELTADNPSQQVRIVYLSSFIDKRIDFSLQIIQLRNGKGIDATRKLMATREGMFYTDKIKNLTAAIEEEENNLLVRRQQENDKITVAFDRVFYTLLASIIILLVIIFFVIRYNFAQRKKAEEQIKNLNADLEHRVEMRTAELNSSEKKYRDIFENNPLSMWVIDFASLKFLDVNDAAIERYGYSREEFLSMSALEIRPEEEKEHFAQVIQSENLPTYNSGMWKHKKKDGTIIDVEIIGHALMHDGKKARLILSNDITERVKAEKEIIELNQNLEEKVKERTSQLATANKELQLHLQKIKQSEEKFSKIFETSPVGICIGALQSGIIIDVNKNFLQMTGLGREEVTGHTSLQLNMIDDVERAKIGEELKQVGQVRNKEIFITKKSGEKIPVLLSLDQFAIGDDEYAITICYDITLRKKAEEQLMAANKELEAFTYSVAHDLRAPLRAVNGYARILEEDYNVLFDAEGKRLLDKVHENASKMGFLIDDLLEFSQLGRKGITKSFIDMNVLTANVLAEINQSTVNNANIKIEKLQPVIGDYALMSHVMTNLLSNAVKYSAKKEKPLIIVSSRKENSELIFSVSDNGVGFEMEYVHKLFGVFQRLHSAEEFPGTGVGLAIVQRIINKHGGSVWAEGKLNEGAVFSFSMPEANQN